MLAPRGSIVRMIIISENRFSNYCLTALQLADHAGIFFKNYFNTAAPLFWVVNTHIVKMAEKKKRNRW